MEKTRIQDLVISIIVMAVGLYALVQGMGMPKDTRPFTVFVSGLFTLLGAILCIGSIINRNKPTSDSSFIPFKEMINPLLAFAIVCAYVAGINILGFFVASTIFMLGFMFWMGYRRPLPMVLTTALMMVFIYFLFVVQLKVRMPSGFLI